MSSALQHSRPVVMFTASPVTTDIPPCLRLVVLMFTAFPVILIFLPARATTTMNRRATSTLTANEACHQMDLISPNHAPMSRHVTRLWAVGSQVAGQCKGLLAIYFSHGFNREDNAYPPIRYMHENSPPQTKRRSWGTSIRLSTPRRSSASLRAASTHPHHVRGTTARRCSLQNSRKKNNKKKEKNRMHLATVRPAVAS